MPCQSRVQVIVNKQIDSKIMEAQFFSDDADKAATEAVYQKIAFKTHQTFVSLSKVIDMKPH